MEPSPARHPLPPGRSGLPLLGETLAFAKNPFRFIDERLAAHGNVFRSHVLGRPTVVIAGPDATAHFIDPERVMREGSMPPHIQELFGGRSLPLLDGDVHRARKALVLQGLSREALAVFLPAMQGIVEGAFERWIGQGEIRWLEELKQLSIEVICTTVIGMAPGEEMEALRRDYATVTGAFSALPIPLPGTRYSRAVQARDRILAALTRRVKERRASPTPADDGLTRILQAKTAAGETLSDEETVLELHHIVIAGYIVFAELAAIVQQLTGHPDVRERLREEVRRLAPSGALTVEALAAMPYLRQVVMEVKRLCPIIPAIFGKARTSFEIDRMTVPAGWMVLWALLPTHTTHGLFSEPARFDPDRFSPERAEHRRHEHAYVPQGAGPATGHRCPGLDFATFFMALFAVVLLRGHDWELPPQSFDYDWSKTPPELADGLRATVRRLPHS
ncbi:MAG: cytochrome P450 [Thermoanaerobaculia bacterium]